MVNDQFIYKELKGYKNLENHWIGGKVKDNNKVVLENKYLLLEFPSNNSSFRISHQLIEHQKLFRRNLIQYDQKSKQVMHKNIIDIWYNKNSEVLLGVPLQYVYIKRKYIERNYISNKSLFFNIEQKRILNLLKDKRLDLFKYLNIWRKVYNIKYNKTLLKMFLLNFLKKQNILYIKKNVKKNDLCMKGIFMGFYKKGIVLYIPSIFKLSLIPHQYLNKNINKLIKKKSKRNKDWFLLYSVFFSYNIYYKMNLKNIKDFI